MIRKLTLTLVVLVLAWGAFAFGAVYEWAYWPLAAAAALSGLLGLVVGRTVTSWPLVIAMSVVALAIGLQLLPLGEPVLRAISPETPVALTQLDPVFANIGDKRHSLSIHPPATRDALLLFGCFALFMIGTSSLLSVAGAERLVVWITIAGVALAMVGIIQEPLYRGKIYGFWKPEQGYDAFGPYVNRNHFAGWMLMAVPLTLGLLFLRIATGARAPKRDLRSRVLWLSSPEAGKLMLTATAAGAMALALVLTLSRSGIAAFGVAMLMTGWIFVRHGASERRRTAALLYLGAMAIAVISVAGVDAVATRFAGHGMQDFGGRQAAWRDALDVAARFPLAGTGMNTYGEAMLLYQTHEIGKYHYSAAHNDYLQVLADGGVLVAAPVAAALVVLTLVARRRMREDRQSSYYWLRAGALAGLVAIAIQELADFSLQIPGNAVLFAVLCAIAIHRRPGRAQAPIRATIPVLQTLKIR